MSNMIWYERLRALVKDKSTTQYCPACGTGKLQLFWAFGGNNDEHLEIFVHCEACRKGEALLIRNWKRFDTEWDGHLKMQYELFRSAKQFRNG